jgi:glutamate/tyrosine decarboxylase-like PLP-dependent enzyme
VPHRRREVDLLWDVARRVDPPAVEELVDEAVAGPDLLVPEIGRVPEARQDHLTAVAQVRE